MIVRRCIRLLLDFVRQLQTFLDPALRVLGEHHAERIRLRLDAVNVGASNPHASREGGCIPRTAHSPHILRVDGQGDQPRTL